MAYDPEGRLFIGLYPAGVVYADTKVEVAGDYKRLAFLSYGHLKLEIEPGVPPELERQILKSAKKIQSLNGQQYQISTCNQTALLGEFLKDGAQPSIVYLPRKPKRLQA